MKRTELKRGTKRLTRKRAKARSRKDTIPPKVRRLVRQRGEECARCWSTWDLELHHRRIKGHGGDTRPHTECGCNIITLCAACHRWVHREGLAEAKETGYVVPRSELFPGSVSVLIGAASGSGASQHLPCDKPYYSTAVPERSAA